MLEDYTATVCCSTGLQLLDVLWLHACSRFKGFALFRSAQQKVNFLFCWTTVLLCSCFLIQLYVMCVWQADM